ncbi:MAG: hypothetical protein GF317_11895 [Candidatus Lokiarchaeota archaeon]|nr:hypothetical protein [Candidatus Lokiarchaeota archaeon]MBD3200349.1 hypothetical protein [Candidatus Lokiarchaeota archaeon]
MKLGKYGTIVRGVLDLDATKSFYEDLGYVKLDGSNTSFKWLLFTDGRVDLLIEEGDIAYTGLVYQNPKFDETLSYLKNNGVEIIERKPRTEEIPASASFLGPEGMKCYILKETHNPETKPDLSAKSKVRFGKFGELAITVNDIEPVIEFWNKLGFKTELKELEPQPWAILQDGNIVLGFHEEDWGDYNGKPAITYFDPNMEDILQELKKEGISISPVEDYTVESGYGVATAPDGLRILLFKGEIP